MCAAALPSLGRSWRSAEPSLHYPHLSAEGEQLGSIGNMAGKCLSAGTGTCRCWDQAAVMGAFGQDVL